MNYQLFFDAMLDFYSFLSMFIGVSVKQKGFIYE